MNDTDDFTYRLLYKRGTKPFVGGEDLHAELETNGIPSGGVRWQFSTRYRSSKPSYRNVLLQSILEMCNEHKLTALEIRHPRSHGGREFVDVVFDKADDALKVYDHEISFDFYGSRPELVDRGMPVRNHVALCIQMLPSDSDLNQVVAGLHADVRIQRAGQVIDVWSLHCPDTGKFMGKVLVLLELHTRKGLVTVQTRAAIPGWFIFRNIAYLVRFPDRPAWCVNCRYDAAGAFHTMYTCPSAPCCSCKKRGHTSVQCLKRQKQVAKKQKGSANEDSDGHEDDDRPRAGSEGARASIERRLAELGIRDDTPEAEELARNFGVLALSEDGFSTLGN